MLRDEVRGPDVDVEHVYGLMGTRGGGTGRIYFHKARVPVENLIGSENGAAAILYQMIRAVVGSWCQRRRNRSGPVAREGLRVDRTAIRVPDQLIAKEKTYSSLGKRVHGSI
jgi:hypothetical protein